MHWWPRLFTSLNVLSVTCQNQTGDGTVIRVSPLEYIQTTNFLTWLYLQASSTAIPSFQRWIPSFPLWTRLMNRPLACSVMSADMTLTWFTTRKVWLAYRGYLYPESHGTDEWEQLTFLAEVCSALVAESWLHLVSKGMQGKLSQVLPSSRFACSQESLRVKPLPLDWHGNAIGPGFLHLSSKRRLTSIDYEYLRATTENARRAEQPASCKKLNLNWFS